MNENVLGVLALLSLGSVVASVVLLRRKKMLWLSLCFGVCGAVSIAYITVAATPTEISTPEREQSTPKPDRHVERVEYQDFWNTTVGDLAMAYLSIKVAAEAADQNDNVGASRVLERGQASADSAKEEALLNVPTAWRDNGAGEKLAEAAEALSDGIGKARAYIDNNEASEMAEAQDDSEKAGEAIQDATEMAQESYVGMGGHKSDLETLQTKIKLYNAVFEEMAGGSNQ